MAGESDTIRVIHVIRSLEFGGAEIMVLSLVASQMKGGTVAPQLVCLQGDGELRGDADALGILCVTAGLGGVRYLSPIMRLRKIFAELKPDIVHTHNFISHVHAAPAARTLGIPVVHTKHGKAVVSFSWSPGFRRWLYHLADRIVVVSGDTGESFKARAGIDPDKIIVIYNGIETGALHGMDRSGARAGLGIREGMTVFGCVSRLDPVKDHQTMLRAFSQVVESRPDSVFLIVGDGPQRGRIEKLIDELSIRDHVIMAGFTDNVPGYLAAMDMYMQPSTEEGLSLTVLEAAAAGIPVVATPVGGTPEIITGGESGTFIGVGSVDELARAMIDCIDNPARFREMADRARERVESTFSLESMIGRYEDLYRSILD